MKKKATKLEQLEKEMEERMKHLVAEAGNDARHFVSQTMQAVLAVQKKYKKQEDADVAARKAMDGMLDAFCRAQCSAWRMMLVQMIEDGIVNPDIITPVKDAKGCSSLR